MGRVIHTERPGTVRHRYRRMIAEMLPRLSQRPTFDDEAKDQEVTS